MSAPKDSVTNKDFFEFVKAIGESKSKEEEDRIIVDEVASLKRKVNDKNLSSKKAKEFLLRMVYVEMLGQDASFAYIKAVEMCASNSIGQKRAGYLVACLSFSPQHEFRFMLVNQIQRDLMSSNQLEACAALHSVCKIVTEDMIPAVIGEVVKLLEHEQDLVRKKAVLAIHRFHQMDPSSVEPYVDRLTRMICDKDPSVMCASLHVNHAMIYEEPGRFKELVPSFVSILKQVIEHRLPRDYDYHRIPAPWMQMTLMRILALLGAGDQSASEGMYEVLADAMRRADTGITAGYAIIYEALRAVTTIYPNEVLMDAAATAISRFIRSDSHNLKYIGIQGLAAIVRDHPRYAMDHQMAVIDCLLDPDESLKRKTLDLLLRMTNSANVVVIVDKLTAFLQSATEEGFRTDLVNRITECAERFAPNTIWYVQTMMTVFDLAGDKVKSSTAQTLLQLIADGEEDEDEDEGGEEDNTKKLRIDAVEDFLTLIEKPVLPPVLAQAAAWVLGEYGYLSESCTVAEIMIKLCDMCDQLDINGMVDGEATTAAMQAGRSNAAKSGPAAGTSNISATKAATKAVIITALMKLCAQNGSCPPHVLSVVTKLSLSRSFDLQQRCLEFRALMTNSLAMVEALPVDASNEDIEVDVNLSFLGNFVASALASGKPPYTPQVGGDDDSGDETDVRSSFKFTPYERAETPASNIVFTTGTYPADHGGMMSPAGGTGPAGGGAAVPSSSTANKPTSAAGLLSGLTVGGSSSRGNQLLGSGLRASGGGGGWGRNMGAPVKPPVEEEAASVPPAVASSSGSSFATPGKPQTQSVDHGAPGTLLDGVAGGGVVPAPAPAPVPEKPRELTEKEKMAQALFGGMSTSSSRLSDRRASRTNKTPNKDGSSKSPRAPASASASASASTTAGGSGDLLDMLGDSDGATPVPAPSPAHPAPSASIDLLDLMGDPSPASTPVAPPSAPLSEPTAPSSLLDAMSLPPTPPVPESSGMGVSPRSITTAEFGGNWGSCAHQAAAFVVPSGAVSGLGGVQNVLTTVGGFHHVETIAATQEAIYAATSADGSAHVYLHCKFGGGRLDAMVRSTTQAAAEAGARAFSAAFA